MMLVVVFFLSGLMFGSAHQDIEDLLIKENSDHYLTFHDDKASQVQESKHQSVYRINRKALMAKKVGSIRLSLEEFGIDRIIKRHAYNLNRYKAHAWSGESDDGQTRLATNSDIVMLWRKYTDTNGDFGVALGWWSDILTDTSAAAYAVGQDAPLHQWVTLNVMAHEVGHLLGSYHNYGDNEPIAILFDYSHGFRFGWNGEYNTYMTVMSYGTGADWMERWVPRFSNPRVTYQGFITGDADTADVARSNNQIRHIAAGWSGAYGSIRVNLDDRIASRYNTEWSIEDGIWHNADQIVSGLTPGSYTVTYRHGRNSIPPKSNDVVVAAERISEVNPVYLADLVLKKLVATPTNINAGQTFDITVNVKNKSRLISSAPTMVMFYLSADKLLDKKDRKLSTVSLPVVNARKSKTLKATVSKSEDISQGEYYLLALLKSTGTVSVGKKITVN